MGNYKSTELVVVKTNNNKSLLRKIFEFLGFSFGPSSDDTVAVVQVDPRVRYLKNSTAKIKMLSNILKCDEFILDETVSMEQSQVLTDIVKIIEKVHHRVETDTTHQPHKLEQFHMYYTDNLINLLDTLKNSRDEVREININIEPYTRKAVSFRDSILEQKVKEFKESKKSYYEDIDDSIHFIKKSKETENSPIFYTMGQLFKVYNDGKEMKIKKLVISDGFQKRIDDAIGGEVTELKMIRKKLVSITFFSMTQEQYSLLMEFKTKIEKYYEDMDGKKERAQLEMDNLKNILNFDLLDI